MSYFMEVPPLLLSVWFAYYSYYTNVEFFFFYPLSFFFFTSHLRR